MASKEADEDPLVHSPAKSKTSLFTKKSKRQRSVSTAAPQSQPFRPIDGAGSYSLASSLTNPSGHFIGSTFAPIQEKRARSNSQPREDEEQRQKELLSLAQPESSKAPQRARRSPSAPETLAETPLGDAEGSEASEKRGGTDAQSVVDACLSQAYLDEQVRAQVAVVVSERNARESELIREKNELAQEREAWRERAWRAERALEKLREQMNPTEKGDDLDQADIGTEYDFNVGDLESNIMYSPDVGEGRPLPQAATLNKLVEKLTEPQTDADYVQIFFLTYRSFTSPFMLLNKLILRYSAPPPHDLLPSEMQDFLEKSQSMIRLRVCNALKQWLEKYYDDFDDELSNRLLVFLDFTVAKTLPAMADKLKRILQRTNQRVKTEMERKTYMSRIQALLKEKKQLERGMEEWKQSLASRSSPPPPLLPKGYRMHLGFLEWDQMEIARQISMIECDMYLCLQPKEFLNTAWSGPNAQTAAPHLYNLIQRFNDATLWVGTLILEQAVLKERVKVLQRFIEVLDHCRTLNNYNALMEIAAGLRGMAVRRLRKTWDELPKKVKDVWDDICKLINPEQNHAKVRKTFPTLIPPKMPFVGLFLSDLTFIEQGNKNESEAGLINFKKRAMVTKTIRQIQLYQTTAYTFEIVPDLHQYLVDMEFLDEEALYQRSLEVEPRDPPARRPGGH